MQKTLYTAIKVTTWHDGYKNINFPDDPLALVRLEKLKKVNIFVGANNSGKSKFMRALFQHYAHGTNWEGVLMEWFERLFAEVPDKITPSDRESIIMSANNTLLDRDFFIYSSTNSQPEFEAVKNQVFNYIWSSSVIDRALLEFECPTHRKTIYIPVLRWLRGYDNWVDVYAARTLGDYWGGWNPNADKFEVFTGLTLYDEIKKLLLGSHEDREFIRSFENFLKEEFFNQKSVTLTPQIGKDVILVKIWNEERLIYNLGDGIQQIIILTFLLFKYRNENVRFLIEEPEVALHPGLQRILLNAFVDGAGADSIGLHQIFFTTHSNHFLDIALDQEVRDSISMYQFTEWAISSDPKMIERITDRSQILDILGVRASSVFLSNCVIWVEGVSDRIYLKKFLELYMAEDWVNKFIEDRHYSIMEYGGGNITHFDFSSSGEKSGNIDIEAIKKHNFLVADTDWLVKYCVETNSLKESESWREKWEETKTQRLLDLKKNLGDRFYCRDREIENTLWNEIWTGFIPSFLPANSKKYIQAKDSIKTPSDWWEPIWKIMKDNYIKSKDPESPPDYFNYKDITCLGVDKSTLAREIVDWIDREELNFNELSQSSQDLTLAVYKFIISANSP
jgi:AAA ATPase domain